MKRLIAVLVLFTFAIFLMSCSYEGHYDDGYGDGYIDGYSDAEFDMQYVLEEELLDYYDAGYYDGYDDGYDEVYNAVEEATAYARSQTGWSVYEAWNNISIYNDGVNPYGHDLPTEEEYRQSIETLVIFCEYLDNACLGG